MKKPSANHPPTNSTEKKCPTCNGTGYLLVVQQVRPGRKIYPPPCNKCGGKRTDNRGRQLRRERICLLNIWIATTVIPHSLIRLFHCPWRKFDGTEKQGNDREKL